MCLGVSRDAAVGILVEAFAMNIIRAAAHQGPTLVGHSVPPRVWEPRACRPSPQVGAVGMGTAWSWTPPALGSTMFANQAALLVILHVTVSSFKKHVVLCPHVLWVGSRF